VPVSPLTSTRLLREWDDVIRSGFDFNDNSRSRAANSSGSANLVGWLVSCTSRAYGLGSEPEGISKKN
jgi:hypothetical protein